MEVLLTKTSAGQMSNMGVADYKLGGGVTKQISLNIWSVKAAPGEATEEVVIVKMVVTATVIPQQQVDAQAQEEHLVPHQQ